jgi:hypothetical protein
MMEDRFSAITQRFANERIPEGLLAQLHNANERFREARLHLEEAMGNTNYDHRSLLDERQRELKRVEDEVEEISSKIHQRMERHQ